MSTKKKRRLTETEIKQLRREMDNAPQGRKPSVRYFARKFGVNQPSILKSLEGWDGIHRGRPPVEKKKKVIEANIESPVKIQGYTEKLKNIEN